MIDRQESNCALDIMSGSPGGKRIPPNPPIQSLIVKQITDIGIPAEHTKQFTLTAHLKDQLPL
jgi:hypothetical protein